MRRWLSRKQPVYKNKLITPEFILSWRLRRCSSHPVIWMSLLSIAIIPTSSQITRTSPHLSLREPPRTLIVVRLRFPSLLPVQNPYFSRKRKQNLKHKISTNNLIGLHIAYKKRLVYLSTSMSSSYSGASQQRELYPMRSTLASQCFL